MSFKSSAVLVMIAALMAAVPKASAATCSNASIKGVYGILSTGLDGSLQPATSVNRVVVDGLGNATGYAMKSLNGQIVTYNFTGTYQIAKNCTGTTTWTNQDNQNEHDAFALNNGNKGAFLIQTDSNHVQSSTAIAQGTVTCTNAGVKQTYSMGLTGTVLSVGQVAVGGQLVFNGSGSITGIGVLSENGVISGGVKVTGTYSINSDCTGTAQITPQGFPTINLGLLVLNADKQMMAVEMDNNTIVSGMLQK